MKNKKLCAIIVLLILFIINTGLVIGGAYTKFDDVVHSNVLRLHSEMTTKIMKIITFFGSTAFMIALAAVLLILFIVFKKKKTGICAVSMLIISTIVNNVIKVIVRRPRPEYMTVIEKSFCYPSGHMMASTTLYGFLVYLLLKSSIPKKYKVLYSTLLVLLVILVGISRIYLGAHYFSDIFGGALMSLSLLLIFAQINEKKKWI